MLELFEHGWFERVVWLRGLPPYIFNIAWGGTNVYPHCVSSSIDPAVGGEKEIVGSVFAIESISQRLDFVGDNCHSDFVVDALKMSKLIYQIRDVFGSEDFEIRAIHSWLMIGRRGRRKAAIIAAGTR